MSKIFDLAIVFLFLLMVGYGTEKKAALLPQQLILYQYGPA